MKKQYIHSCLRGEIPYCQFLAKCTSNIDASANVPDFECTFEVCGTKERCSINVDISPSQGIAIFRVSNNIPLVYVKVYSHIK